MDTNESIVAENFNQNIFPCNLIELKSTDFAFTQINPVKIIEHIGLESSDFGISQCNGIDTNTFYVIFGIF